ncbi:MAG: maltodextrin glucosidase [Natronospirillum sp.]
MATPDLNTVFPKPASLPSVFHAAIPGYLDVTAQGIALTLKVLAEESITHVWVRTDPDNEEHLSAMAVGEVIDGWRYCNALIPLDHVRPHTAYVFKIQLADRMLWLSADGEHSRMPAREVHFKHAHEAPPEWVSEQIFYQVFPDRFRNGDASLNVQDEEYEYLGGRPVKAREWHELPSGEHGPSEFFNGDLPGVCQSLEYLQNTLGVTSIYLNPVFRSDSNHKYDTIDYFHVDPHLGGNSALVDLREETDKRGMKLMLDGVLNHTSIRHDWFIRAQAGEKPYVDYFLDAEGDYVSWKGHKSLPVVDYANPEVVDVFYQADNSVLRHWLRPPYSIDGWRLDVIHMLGEGKGAANNDKHVRAMRRVLKEENTDAYLLGEHFFEATQWLQGDQEDGAMNYYGFLQPVWMFLAGHDIARHQASIDADEMASWMREARAKIPFNIAKTQFNQLDSHDTPRMLTLLGGDQARLVMAVRLQMAYLGVPCIYYGDEVGLQGGEDPHCRAPFPWDSKQWNDDLLHRFQQAIRWRKELPALRDGAVVDLHAEGDQWVFARVLKDTSVLASVNRADTAVRQATNVRLISGAPAQHWCNIETGQIVQADAAGNLVLPLAATATELWVATQ